MFDLRWAAIGLSLALVAAGPSAGQSIASQAQMAAARGEAQGVDPTAVQALGDMAAYLQSLSTFELTSKASLDLVTNNDQKIQLDGVGIYKVRKPDAFVIDFVSDDWNRRYIYRGKEFTQYAPTLGYFSAWPAPDNIKDTIADAETRFGISLPLDDLFRWSGPEGIQAYALENAFIVGVETLDGVKTTHYAFRDGEIDWQVWIQQGARPLPRKIVIVDRTDPVHPTYTARLSWTLNPRLSDRTFTAYLPPKDAKRIRIVEQTGQ